MLQAFHLLVTATAVTTAVAVAAVVEAAAVGAATNPTSDSSNPALSQLS